MATKQKAKPMTDSEKAAKFKEHAEKRVTRALRAIHGVSKLAGSRYKYTPQQVERIGEAFKAALTQMGHAFEGKKSGGGGFTL